MLFFTNLASFLGASEMSSRVWSFLLGGGQLANILCFDRNLRFTTHCNLSAGEIMSRFYGYILLCYREVE